MKKFFLLMIILFIPLKAEWQFVGFGGKNVKRCVQHPIDTNIILISIADTIYRSSDGGNTWSKVFQFYGLPVSNITFHPEHCDTVFALVGMGSYSDACYRSTDTGNTWQFLEYFYKPLSMTIAQHYILLGGIGYVYKSEDGGNSWTLMTAGLENTNVYVLDNSCPFGTDFFPFFFAGTAGGLFYWKNNQWNRASGIGVNAMISSISFDKDGQNPMIVYAGNFGDGVRYSEDGGVTWDSMNQGLTNKYELFQIFLENINLW